MKIINPQGDTELEGHHNSKPVYFHIHYDSYYSSVERGVCPLLDSCDVLSRDVIVRIRNRFKLFATNIGYATTDYCGSISLDVVAISRVRVID